MTAFLGLTPFVIASRLVLLADRAYQHNLLGQRVGKSYLWLMNLVTLGSFFGVGNWLSLGLSALFIGFSLRSFIRVYVKGIESNSILFPVTDPERQFKLGHIKQETLRITDKSGLNVLFQKLRIYDFKLTYNHFRQAKQIASKLLSDTPSVDVNDYIQLFGKIDFQGNDLISLIAAEMTSQDKFFGENLELLKKELSLPQDSDLSEVYVSYLKREIRYCVERLHSTHSRDMQQEKFIAFQKQARHVLKVINENFNKDKASSARILIEIALKTGSHCNKVYADTFSDLSERLLSFNDTGKTAKLSLQERTVFALQSFREKCFRNYYYYAVAQFEEQGKYTPLALMFQDVNDYHSYEHFVSVFGPNFYLRNNLFGLESSLPWINKCYEYYYRFTLHGIKFFDSFYQEKLIIDEVLTPGTHLNTLFAEWCNNSLYEDCYQSISYDEDFFPIKDLKKDKNIRILAKIMLADLGVFQLDRAYVSIAMSSVYLPRIVSEEPHSSIDEQAETVPLHCTEPLWKKPAVSAVEIGTEYSFAAHHGRLKAEVRSPR